MTPRAYARRNGRLLFALGFFLGLVVIAARHGFELDDTVRLPGLPELPNLPDLGALIGREQAGGAQPVAKPVRGDAGAPQVHDVQLVRQGYFEAIVKVRYSATQDHQAGRGYLYLHERDHPRGTGVGAFVKAGTHTARVYLNRRLAHKGPYTSGQIVALVYRYGKGERPYFEQDVPLSLRWPGLREAGVERRVERYPDVRRLQLYRNIPRYEAFALNLVERGFPAGQMTILYAPCRKCRAGLHFGPQVRVEVLQEILTALKEHGSPVHWVDYDPRPAQTGQVLIGWTPSKQARPLWRHLDRLLEEDLSLQEFAQTVGLELR